MSRHKRIVVVIALGAAVIGSPGINAQQDQQSSQQQPPQQAPAPEPRGSKSTKNSNSANGSLSASSRLKQEADDTKAKEQAAKAKETPIVKAGQDGFSLQSADGNFVLRLRGYVQADGRFYPGDDANNATDTFLLRRVRRYLRGRSFAISTSG